MFLETPRFPENISLGAKGGPQWNTTVAVKNSGKEQRTGKWQYPRQKWDVSHGLRNASDFATLRTFFLICKGRLSSFRFKDWTDFQVAYSESVVVGITTKIFQCYKRYTLGSYNFDRILYKLVGTTSVKVFGVLYACTVDSTKGTITFADDQVAANITFTTEFDVPMRFDTDTLEAAVESYSPNSGYQFNWSNIPILEDLYPF